MFIKIVPEMQDYLNTRILTDTYATQKNGIINLLLFAKKFYR